MYIPLPAVTSQLWGFDADNYNETKEEKQLKCDLDTFAFKKKSEIFLTLSKIPPHETTFSILPVCRADIQGFYAESQYVIVLLMTEA